MEAWQQRVIDERKELLSRRGKLADFIADNPQFEGLSSEDQYLLRRQRDIMTEYYEILTKRIARFK